MNNANAIIQGRLANNIRFFGSATAEIVSTTMGGASNSAWHEDRSYTAFSTSPWYTGGGRPENVQGAGIFGFYGYAGVDVDHVSHRTILLGY